MKLIFFFLLLTSLSTYAQKVDSVQVDYSTETIKLDSAKRYGESRMGRAVYRRFIRAQVQETTLFKVSGLPFWAGGPNGSNFWGYQSQMGVEQKITPAFSINAVNWIRYHNERDYADNVKMRLFLEARWYFSMNRQMRLGKRANNFSSQYIGLGTVMPFLNKTTYVDPAKPSPYQSGGDLFVKNYEPATLLSIGMQRRLGRLGYLDLSFYTAHVNKSANWLTAGLNFSIGFGR